MSFDFAWNGLYTKRTNKLPGTLADEACNKTSMPNCSFPGCGTRLEAIIAGQSSRAKDPDNKQVYQIRSMLQVVDVVDMVVQCRSRHHEKSEHGPDAIDGGPRIPQFRGPFFQ